MVARALALAAIVACTGKARPEEAAPAATPRGDAPLVDVAARDAALIEAAGDAGARDAAGDASAATGDLQVRVTWPDVPAAARSSPGRTPCNTPRAASVLPSTMWGIPDALVVVGGAARPTTARPTTAHITLADCALAPRITTGASLAITSAVDRPARVALRKRGTPDQLVAGDAIPVMLPIAGHTVTTALDAGAIYSLETDAADPELAYVSTMPGSHVTDAGGQTAFHELPAGAHAVTAWLPPRAGQPARLARGTAQVKAGTLTELTLTLAP